MLKDVCTYDSEPYAEKNVSLIEINDTIIELLNKQMMYIKIKLEFKHKPSLSVQ